MFELVQLLAADSDIQRSYEWFAERNESRGLEFLRAMDAAYERIKTWPRSAPQVDGEFHRMIVKNFDHGIFFKIHGRRIVVSAVLDLRQNPEAIRARLGL